MRRGEDARLLAIRAQPQSIESGAELAHVDATGAVGVMGVEDAHELVGVTRDKLAQLLVQRTELRQLEPPRAVDVELAQDGGGLRHVGRHAERRHGRAQLGRVDRAAAVGIVAAERALDVVEVVRVGERVRGVEPVWPRGGARLARHRLVDEWQPHGQRGLDAPVSAGSGGGAPRAAAAAAAAASEEGGAHRDRHGRRREARLVCVLPVLGAQPRDLMDELVGDASEHAHLRGERRGGGRGRGRARRR